MVLFSRGLAVFFHLCLLSGAVECANRSGEQGSVPPSAGWSSTASVPVVTEADWVKAWTLFSPPDRAVSMVLFSEFQDYVLNNDIEFTAEGLVNVDKELFDRVCAHFRPSSRGPARVVSSKPGSVSFPVPAPGFVPPPTAGTARAPFPGPATMSVDPSLLISVSSGDEWKFAVEVFLPSLPSTPTYAQFLNYIWGFEPSRVNSETQCVLVNQDLANRVAQYWSRSHVTTTTNTTTFTPTTTTLTTTTPTTATSTTTTPTTTTSTTTTPATYIPATTTSNAYSPHATTSDAYSSPATISNAYAPAAVAPTIATNSNPDNDINDAQKKRSYEGEVQLPGNRPEAGSFIALYESKSNDDDLAYSWLNEILKSTNECAPVSEDVSSNFNKFYSVQITPKGVIAFTVHGQSHRVIFFNLGARIITPYATGYHRVYEQTYINYRSSYPTLQAIAAIIPSDQLNYLRALAFEDSMVECAKKYPILRISVLN